MNAILKQSTSVVISFGPFVDKTDGVSLETGLVSALDHATTGIMLSKNGGTLAVRHATVTASTYDAHGCYKVTLDTTDTGTLGQLRVIYTDPTTCLAVWRDFKVVPATVFDALVTNATNGSGGLIAATGTISAATGYVGSSGAAVNGTNVNTLLDAAVSSRASQTSLDALVTTVGVAGAGLTAADDAVLAAIAALVIPNAAQNAAAVEAAILDEGDATALLAAIAAKVETFVINDGDASATLTAIAAAVRTNLATELGRIDENVSAAKTLTSAYDAAKTAASQTTADADHDATQAAIAGLNNIAAADVVTELGTGSTLTDLASQTSVDDLPTNAELAAALSGIAAPSASAVADEVETRELTLTSAYDAAKVAASQASADADHDATQAAIAVISDAMSDLPTNTELADELGLLQAHGDLTWATGEGGTPPTVEEIADEVEGRNLIIGSFEASALQQLGSLGTIRVETPTVAESTVQLRQGDSYLAANNRQLSFTNPQGTWPNLTGADCVLEFIINGLKIECDLGTVITAVGLNQRVDFDVPSAITSQLNYSVGRFELTAILPGDAVATLRVGTLQTTLNL